MKIARLSLSVLAVVMLCSGAYAAQDERTHEARAFWQMFEDDRHKAGAELLEETVRLTGVVVETGMSIYMTPTVRLSDRSDGPVYVICVLPRADTPKLAGFAKGERVTMRGRVYRSQAGGGVVVKECKRVD